jgi:tetratricopeptide (TPR) repeat protein
MPTPDQPQTTETALRRTPLGHAPALSPALSAGLAAAPSRLALVLVLALASVPYLFGLDGGFVYDDELLLVANPALQDLRRLPELLGSSLWSFVTPEQAESVDYWRPLTWLVLALTHAAGGGGPLAFKIASLALHLGATAAVARFARRLGAGPRGAAAAALLFGVHPLGVEAVTWSSALNDPLLVLCACGAASAWLDWRRAGAPGAPLAFAAWFAAGLLAKESALALAVLPFALEGAVATAGGGRARRATLATLALVVFVYWLARVAVFGSLDGGLGYRADFGASTLELLRLRLEFVGGALALIAWPAELVVFRPFRPNVESLDLVVPTLALVAGAALLVVAWRRDRRVLAALAFTALVLVVPSLRIESLGKFPLSDRFVYGALPGATIALALALERWCTTRPRLRVAALLVVLAAAALGTRGALRTAAWHDPRTFWETAADECPDVVHVWWNLGRLELARFRAEPTLPTATRARELFEHAGDLANLDREGRARAAATSFDVLQTNLGLGWSVLAEAELDGFSDPGEALLVFEQVVRMRPGSHEAWTGRGVALARKGDLEHAVASFTRALELYPDYPEAHFDLGLVRATTGDWVKARNHFERALELRPAEGEYALWAAKAADARGDAAASLELSLRASELLPGAAAPLVVRAVLASRAGDFERALELLDAALRLEPTDFEAHNERAKVLLRLEREDDAFAQFVEAARIGPNEFEPHFNVASMLMQTGASLDALLPYLQRAYELCPDATLMGMLRGNLDRVLADGDPLRATLALMDERRGQYDAALEWAESASGGDDPAGDAAYVYGRMLLRVGRANDALVWLEQANERGPDQFLRLRELGSARAAAGDAAGARRAWERALAVLPPPQDERERARAEELTAQIRSGLDGLDQRASDAANGAASDAANDPSNESRTDAAPSEGG